MQGFDEQGEALRDSARVPSSGELVGWLGDTRERERGMVRVLTTRRSFCGGLGRQEGDGTRDQRRPELGELQWRPGLGFARREAAASG